MFVLEKRPAALLISKVSLIAATVVMATDSVFAQSGSVFVDARANVFGYGLGTPAPGGGGGGILAPVVALSAGSGRSFTIASATGTVNFGGGNASNGADGQGLGSAVVTVDAIAPISGITAPGFDWLVGVFVENGDISGLGSPPSFSYPDVASLSASSFSPLMRQVFIVGDGRTGAGTGGFQVFNIPDGAGALVLGFVDAGPGSRLAGFYSDNTGGITVTFVPTPPVGTLLGIATLASRRRRR